MNKKFLFGMFAAASMLFTTSCSEEEILSNSNGNDAKVTFSLALENELGTKTRAISDGKTVNQLTYAVFNEDGEILNVHGTDGTVATQIVDANEFTTGGQKEVTVMLAKGQTYKIAFWAQASTCAAYTVNSSTMEVTVDYSKLTNNQESADAFFKTIEYKVTGNASVPVKLTRPFAQLNVAVTAKDWAAAVASGIEIETSTVTVNKVGNKIDLLTGEVSGNEEVTFAANAIPGTTEALTLKTPIDVDGDGTNETSYKYISTTYLLINDETATGEARATLTNAQFQFLPETGKGNPIDLKDGLNNIPVQRNWRTNIVGQILTGTVKFQVSIEPSYVDDIVNPTEVKNVEAANTAFANGETSVAIKEVESTASLINLPNTTSAVNISLPGTSNAMTIDYSTATSALKPAVLNITVSDTEDIDNITFNLPNTTVYVNGKIINATANTATNTLIVTAGSSIENLTIGQGNVSIEKGGNVTNIVRSTTNLTTKTFVFVANGVTTRPNTTDANIIFGSYDAYADYKVQYENAGVKYNFESVLDACAYANSVAPTTTDITLALTGDIIWNTGVAGNGANTMIPAPFTSVTINGNNYVFTAEGQGGIKGNADVSVTFNKVEFVDNTAYTTQNGETAWEWTYLEFEGSKYVFNDCTFQNTISAEGAENTFTNCRFYGKTTLESNKENEYAAWVANGVVLFKECTFEGLYRGIKICEDAGYDVTSVTIDGCTFKNISKKPGVAIDNKTDNLTVIIKNSSFTNVQPGDQSIFFYESKNVTPTLENNVLAIESAEELRNIANVINGYVAAGEENMPSKANELLNTTIKLMKDIDLNNEDWTPIGNVVAYPGVTFKGIFDGNNFSIKNLKATDTTPGYAAAGLFGSTTGKIKNLTIDGATINSTHYAGAICGFSSANVGMEIDNCHVKNATIISSIETLTDESYDNGDKVGGIIGYMVAGDKVTNCTVENITIQGYRDLGGIAGYARGTITDCKVLENVKIIASYEEGQNYKKYTTEAQYDANSIVGDSKDNETSATLKDNSGTATITYNIPSAE